jgi:hypothetical protein
MMYYYLRIEVTGVTVISVNFCVNTFDQPRHSHQHKKFQVKENLKEIILNQKNNILFYMANENNNYLNNL